MEEMEKVDKENAEMMQTLTGNMNVLATAITEGFAMLRDVLMPNTNHGNIQAHQHQFGAQPMQNNSRNMQNTRNMQVPHYQAQTYGYSEGSMAQHSHHYRRAVEDENDELELF